MRRALASALMAAIAIQATGCSLLATRHRLMGATGDTMVGIGGLMLLTAATESSSSSDCGGGDNSCGYDGTGTAMVGLGLAAVGALIGVVAVATSADLEPSPEVDAAAIAALPPREPVVAHASDPALTHLAALGQAAALTGRCDVASILMKRVERRDRAYAYRVRDSGALAPCE
ncbi:MAG: hypothetical protein K8W52_03905 [Deltaproteobacteria bacterium]|nr:hypothetical protein [Deltaproteobacteria bacterium]